MTTITAGPLSWNWNESWAQLPQSDGFAHHGLQVRSNGEIIVGDVSEPVIHRLAEDGSLIGSFSAPVAEVHGLTIAEWNGGEVLWICDVAKKAGVQKADQGKVIACDFSGTVVAEITAATIPQIGDAWFSPTACAVDPRNGDIWITDGYGQGEVHCIGADLQHKFSIDGSTGAGRFNNPHWIHADTGKAATEIYVADRMNHRIQIFASNGSYLRTIGEGSMNTPSAIAAMGDRLVVAELQARVVILDAHDNIIDFIGDGREYVSRPGWPNRRPADAPEGSGTAPTDLEAGKFNSPHGVAADSAGNIFVSEWLKGGRFIKLEAVS